jgi:hypothetical protein
VARKEEGRLVIELLEAIAIDATLLADPAIRRAGQRESRTSQCRSVLRDRM